MAHLWTVGQSGTGKSAYLEGLFVDAVTAGDAAIYIDPHGESTDRLLPQIPWWRTKHVTVFDPSREDVLPFNPLAKTDNPRKQARAVAEAMKVGWRYGGASTSLMDIHFTAAFAALIEAGETMLGFPDFITNAAYRSRVLGKVEDQSIKAFWRHWFEAHSPGKRLDISQSSFTKGQMLVLDDDVRNVLAYRESGFELSDIVKNKILFICLREGKLTLETVEVLGSIMLALIHQACLDRPTRKPLHIFIDECHKWSPTTLKEMLSGIRKFNVHLYLAHQYLAQFDETDRSLLPAIMGNCETQRIFRTSAADAKFLVERMGRGKPERFTDLKPLQFFHYPVDGNVPRTVELPRRRAYGNAVRQIEWVRKSRGTTRSRAHAARTIALFEAAVGTPPPKPKRKKKADTKEGE